VLSAFGQLSPRQRALVDRWLPGARVERDHGWGLVDTTVLEVTHAGSRYIVKAGGDDDRHIARELHARHRTRVRAAIGTAAWAYRVGDEVFEAQGHRMIAEALPDS
jgi:hypothetical protein